MKTKRTNILTLLLAFLLAVPAFGQVSIDENAVAGTWKFTKDEAKVTMTFKEDHTYSNKIFIAVEQLDGALSITWQGTWATEADTLIQKMDMTTINVKYVGNNKEVGQQIEQMMNANKGALAEQFASKETDLKMCNVVVADDIMTYTTMQGETPQTVIMTRSK
ncbi:MAG: hypothetical protein IJ729_03075 [Alloprevotella sp.]|nr:hypothetical protein [Alloprevotella sp.]